MINPLWAVVAVG